MKNYKLGQYEIEDLEFALSDFEKQYGIHFNQDELNSIECVEQLTEAISNKFDYESSSDCTSQRAFYKLRNVLNKLNTGNQNIKPDLELAELIPRKGRIQKVKEIETELGFELNVLQPKNWIFYSAIFLWIGVILLFFFHFFYALILAIFNYYFFGFIFKKGKEFKVSTVEELVNKIVMENYFRVRRTSNTINKIEFKKVVLEWFSDRMDMDKEELKSAKFI
ncbi:hypothetical protein [Epilithonimonas sp.]|uniref:hypothetical protein n=1 Tax=Epilithonimonas sp. TaxID=2894511 RepID=UPI0028A25D5A|nr:hypothetical protein [Epilithonimonas sp.]